MDSLDFFVQDLIILFNLDLLNKFEQVDNSVIITMEDGSKVRVQVKQLA